MTLATIDLYEFRDLVESELDCFTYVESEGPDSVRFDIGERSAWARNYSPYFDGDVRIIRQLTKILDKMPKVDI